jgi:hypothetical protein
MQEKGGRLMKNLGPYTTLFFAAYFFYIASIIYAVYKFIYAEELPEKYFFYLIPVVIFILIGFGRLMVGVADFIRSKSIKIPNNLVLFLLLFAYSSTLPLLQVKLNRVSGDG